MSKEYLLDDLYIGNRVHTWNLGDPSEYSNDGYTCYICGEIKEYNEFVQGDFYYKSQLIHICNDCSPDVDFSYLQSTKSDLSVPEDDLYSMITSGQTQYKQVYFILNKSKGFIKIGISRNYKTRFEQLEKDTLDHLEILLVVTANPKLEKLLHKMFWKNRVGGEWFKITKGLVETIKNIDKVAKYQNRCIVSVGNFSFLYSIK